MPETENFIAKEQLAMMKPNVILVNTARGGLIHEGAAVVLNGRISIREDKDPQMVVNRVWAIGDMQAAQQDAAPQYHTLYLRVARTGQKGEQKLLPILHMFPGKLKTVIYYADTGVRRGGTCAPQDKYL